MLIDKNGVLVPRSSHSKIEYDYLNPAFHRQSHPLHLYYSFPKVPRKPSYTRLSKGDVQSVQRKNVLNIFETTLMLRDLRLIVSFAHRAISGSDSDRILLIVLFLGMLTGRAALPRNRRLEILTALYWILTCPRLEQIQTPPGLRNAILYCLQTHTCASLMPNVCYAIFATSGSALIPKIILWLSKNGSIIEQLVRTLSNVLLLQPIRRLLSMSSIIDFPYGLFLFCFSRYVEVPPLSEQQLALASLPSISRTPPSSPSRPLTSTPPVVNGDVNRITPSFKGELNPSNFPSSHESRQKSAEQRAVSLRLDPLLEEVEPNRVFCTLCQKWVQLRQDSSYCAYPWLHHRAKCLTRK